MESKQLVPIMVLPTRKTSAYTTSEFREVMTRCTNVAHLHVCIHIYLYILHIIYIFRVYILHIHIIYTSGGDTVDMFVRNQRSCCLASTSCTNSSVQLTILITRMARCWWVITEIFSTRRSNTYSMGCSRTQKG